MANKLQRYRDDYSGCEPDEEGQWIDIYKVDKALEDARDELFAGPRSREFEDGVNELLNILKKNLDL